ncbi:hypothetical protein, partial [Lentzea atacamensis]|uniref:hypothetical protein n=1 Tax=Lentzea atacamensis TaxID=531938 RepID=UPI001B87E314
STGWSGSQIKVAISEDSSSPALGSLAEQGIHVDGVDGERLIAEAGRNPLQIAAQVATVLGPGCVRVRSGMCTVVLLCARPRPSRLSGRCCAARKDIAASHVGLCNERCNRFAAGAGRILWGARTLYSPAELQ